MKTFKQFQEGLLKKAVIGTGLALGGLNLLKKKFDPVGNARKKYQDKKATDYE